MSLYTVNSVVFKGEIQSKAQQRGYAGGCTPPDLRQGLRPWTHSPRSYLVDITEEAPRAALGTKYSKLSGTMKISENARGKAAAKLVDSCQRG